MFRILLAVLALLLPVTSAATPRPCIEGGVGFVWLSDDLDIEGRNPSARPDFNLAALAQFEFDSGWSLLSGLRYSRLGNEVEFDSPGEDPFGLLSPGTARLQSHYIGVPVIGRWTHTTSGSAAPFLFAGAEFAHLLESTIDFEPEDGIGGTDETEITADMNRLNVTAMVGTGVTIAKSDHRVDVAVRVALGLVDTLETPGVSWLTRELSLTLGFRR